MPDAPNSPEPSAVGAELEKLPPEAQVALPAGVQPSKNYLAAVELGHVLARSGLYTDVRDPAKAAVKVMIGMDLGVSPTAAMQGIHTFEEEGKTVFLIEGKLLAGVVKARPDVDYKYVERTDEKVEIEFLRRKPSPKGWGKWETQEPNVVWTIERAKREVPKFANKTKTWGTMPMVMLTWRALVEGIRMHFPDVISGQPIYLEDEIENADGQGMRAALDGPKVQPLTDRRADELRAKMREVFDELKDANPARLTAAAFAGLKARAEHSHDRLEDEVARLEFLRDTERTLQALYAEIRQALDDTAAKGAIDRCEREPNGEEKIARARAVLAESKGGGNDGK